MRKTGAYVWAGLDLLTFMRNLLYLSQTVHNGFSGLTAEGIFNVVTRDLLLLSLLFSAYYTFKQRKLGAWIYWGQLPVRFYFYAFSFTSLRDLPILEVFESGGQILLISLVVVELLRIVYTVRYFHDFHPKTNRKIASEELLDS